MEEPAQLQGPGAVLNAAGGSWTQDSHTPAPRRPSTRQVFPMSSFTKGMGRELPFIDCVPISLALHINYLNPNSNLFRDVYRHYMDEEIEA